MLKILSNIILFLVLSSCMSGIESDKETEIIDDSFFFQKKSLNFNIYQCQKYNDLGLTNYRSDQEQINYIKVSEIAEKDINIDGCDHIYFVLDELTPSTTYLLDDGLFIEILNCQKLNDVDIDESMKPYLESIKINSVEIWTGVSKPQASNFTWVNIWLSEKERTQIMSKWIKSSASGVLVSELAANINCPTQQTINFN